MEERHCSSVSGTCPRPCRPRKPAAASSHHSTSWKRIYPPFLKEIVVTDPRAHVAPTYTALAERLSLVGADAWDAQSLCEKWLVRHVIAHVTMPVRMTPEKFGAEMAAAGGDFGVLSDTVALRDGDLPVEVLLEQLRSPKLHEWETPGGGWTGSMTHAVVHSMDVTIPLQSEAAPALDARLATLHTLVDSKPPLFGVTLEGVRLEADDCDWSWGDGHVVRGDSASLVALVAGRTLPDGR